MNGLTIKVKINYLFIALSLQDHAIENRFSSNLIDIVSILIRSSTTENRYEQRFFFANHKKKKKKNPEQKNRSNSAVISYYEIGRKKKE